jgi:hypothetical protein
LAKDKDHKAKHDNHFLVKKVKKQVDDLKQATNKIELLQKNHLGYESRSTFESIGN